MFHSVKPWLCCSFAFLLLAGCGGSGTSDAPGTDSYGSSNPNASLDKNAYPVFPDADAGADPSVSAELGGKGFTGEGWETNTAFETDWGSACRQRRFVQGIHLGLPRHSTYGRPRMEHVRELPDQRDGLRNSRRRWIPRRSTTGPGLRRIGRSLRTR